jgi:hypothetical protein
MQQSNPVRILIEFLLQTTQISQPITRITH